PCRLHRGDGEVILHPLVHFVDDQGIVQVEVEAQVRPPGKVHQRPRVVGRHGLVPKGPPVLRADQGAVVGDQVAVDAQPSGIGQRRPKHPSRGEDQLDAAGCRLGQGSSRLVQESEVRLQQGIVQVDRDQLGSTHRLFTTMDKKALTMLSRIDAHTAAQNPWTAKPGTSPLASQSIKPLSTNVNSPSVSRLMGSVSTKSTGRTKAFTSPSTAAPMIRASGPLTDTPL